MLELKLSQFKKNYSASKNLREDNSFTLGPLDYIFSAPAIYGILGSNGSGKSTLLKSIFEESKHRFSTSLEISFTQPLSIRSKDFDKFRISFCDTRGSFDPDWRVNDLLIFSRFSFHQGYPGIKDQQIISDITKLLSLDKIIFQSMSTLSTGLLQKVWLASSLVQEPDVLLLDEPTSHLDAKQKNNFMELLENILGTPTNATKLILLSSHDIHLCLDYCDHVIGLKNGKICYDRRNDKDSVSYILNHVYDD